MKRSKRTILLGTMTVIMLTAAIGMGLFFQKGNSQILDADQFDDPLVRQAYKIAHDMPDVLASVPCFCGCMRSNKLHHGSNLDCFKSKHAEFCAVCISTALSAGRLKQQGKSTEEIQRYVENVFGYNVLEN